MRTGTIVIVRTWRVVITSEREAASTAIPRGDRPERSQHHRCRTEAAHVATGRQQTDQAARGRARLSDLHTGGAGTYPHHAGRPAGDRPGRAYPAGSAKHQES